MIHYTREGDYLRLGLNFRFTPWSVTLIWAWYDFASHNATTYRLRVRMHRKPRFMFEKNRHNVIDAYLHLHGMEVVHSEVLADLKAIEKSTWRRLENRAWIQPGKP
ncbi:MAG: hypothetical protein RL758_299 [Pseudomonadota bacterium]|jgi:hypothetical protein